MHIPHLYKPVYALEMEYGCLYIWPLAGTQIFRFTSTYTVRWECRSRCPHSELARWSCVGDRRIMYRMQTLCCNLSVLWRSTWAHGHGYSNHIEIWHNMPLHVLTCIFCLVILPKSTVQIKASDICILSCHHRLCLAFMELTNSIWS